MYKGTCGKCGAKRTDNQIGLESTPQEFVDALVAVFREVKRVLRDDGTCWLNLGDSFASNGGAHGGRADNQSGVGAKRTHDAGAGDQEARRAPNGLKPKDLIGIPWRVAFALQSDGWYLRSDIIWSKPNPMPESVTDRPTKAHEYIFLLSKSQKYFYDADAIREPHVRTWDESNGRGIYGGKGCVSQKQNSQTVLPHPNGRNRRTVWEVSTAPYSGAHFATFPPKLIEPCILAGCPIGGTVLDPFGGSGTTAMVARQHGRKSVLIELNPEYVGLMRERLNEAQACLIEPEAMALQPTQLELT